MTTFVHLVMEAAAIELLNKEATEIEEEVERLLSEVEQGTVEDARRGVLLERFMALLKRRGATVRKALILFEQSRDRESTANAERAAITVPQIEARPARPGS